MNRILLFCCLFNLCYPFSIAAQIDNPMPDKIRPSGLLYQLEEVFTIQKSAVETPLARINMLRESPDNSNRLFVIDLNGFLWQIDQEEQQLFLAIKQYFNRFIDAPGKGTGFGAFAFHPGFKKNGKFYTSHAELPDSAPADYVPPVDSEISMQWVLVEWTMDAPSSPTFSGTHRELLRVDFPGILHGIQDIQFNPTAKEDDPDYGKLYVCFGDGASSLNLQEDNLQNKASYLGTIFRIDPLGNNSPNGQYGIPADNPFFDEDNVLKEIYCYGFRNPHRISWDTEADQLMLIADIGEKNLEEVNIGHPGANYGWEKREGTFLYDRSKGRDFVYPLPPDDPSFGFTYPIAQYDHDEGLAIVGGYVYRGSLFPDLYGNYIFGDIPSGRVFHFPVADVEEGRLAEIKELNFLDDKGDRTTFLKIVNGDRADLRFGIDDKGELYFLTKADGKVRRLKANPLTTTSKASPVAASLLISPNPVIDRLHFTWPEAINSRAIVTIMNLEGKLIRNKEIFFPHNYLDVSGLLPGAYIISLQSQNQIFNLRFIKQ